MENENNQPVVNQADNKPFSFKKEISTPMAILAAGVIIAIAVIYSNTGGDRGSKQPTDAAKAPATPQAQVSAPQFKQCLDSGRNAQKVEEDSQDAVASGGRGTPFNVIVDKNGKLFAFSGALPYAPSTMPAQLGSAAGGAATPTSERAFWAVRRTGAPVPPASGTPWRGNDCSTTMNDST